MSNNTELSPGPCGVSGAGDIFTYSYAVIVVALGLISALENILVIVVVRKHKDLQVLCSFYIFIGKIRKRN